MNYDCHITTFYSYKGGVGRTMLLVNTGALLARMGRKVLLCDLDVEAPGMHVIPQLTPAPAHETGFLEWLYNLQETRKSIIPDPKDLQALSDLIRPVPGIDNLFILPAFGTGADSAGLYQDIRWQDFLAAHPDQGLELFRGMLDHFADQGEFDHILLDARTGITDLGGLMTAILPHAVVLVGSYGSQNFSGLQQVDRALLPATQGKYAIARAPLPDLKRLIVVSPVPQDQEKRLAARRREWDKAFPGLSGEGDVETRVEIPFDSRLLFREDLLAIDDESSDIAAAYNKIAAKIDAFLEDLTTQQTRALAEAAAYPDAPHARLKDPRQEKGKTFEERVARLLTLLGYQTEGEQYVDGNRVDLIARQSSGLRQECYFVECKDHRKPVGKNVLEKLAAWLNSDQARSMHAMGMVVARAFSPAARTFANANSTILIFTPEELERRLFDFGPYLARLKQEFEAGKLARTYVDQRVLLEKEPAPDGADLLDHAQKWAAGQGSRLWLLLGDFGTGKTAFFKRFTYEMARKCADNPDLPVPIAVDLKAFPNAISLEGLLQEHLRASVNWNGNPEILLHLLASGRIILLLDAFDEMGTAAIGRGIEEQFRQLLKPLAASGDKKGNRILITCRTHFFKDQQNVKDLLYGTRDDLVSRDSDLGKLARAFDGTIDELMLFNPDQIRMFLNRHLSKTQARQAQTFIQETYDLPSLAPRPVLLEMIVNSLPELIKSKGGISPAGLYHVYTTRWLEDQSGALQTSARLRKKILEHLAFELWGKPQHHIHHRELITVLEKLEPGMLSGIDPDRVDLELRTAAFLIRSKKGYYTFSHKSFREFFYSRHLLASLKQGPEKIAKALATAPITPECAAFFCDLVHHGQEKPDEHNGHGFDTAKAHIKTILAAPYTRHTSENALLIAYFCADYLTRHTETGQGLAHCMQDFMPPAARLHGARLKEVNLKGAWLAGADLSGADLEESDLSNIRADKADFSQAILNRANLEQARCRNADFSKADLREIQARQGDFTNAVFDNADLTGAILVKTTCTDASFKAATCHRTRFAAAGLKNVNWQGADLIAVTAPGAAPRIPGTVKMPKTFMPLIQNGQGSGVNSAVFSSDSKQILTASNDQSVALFDITIGKLMRRFSGHNSSVNSAVFSSNNKMVLTASADRTAALFDASNGKLIRRFAGHNRSVNSAVFSPDGKLVLTASSDQTVAMFDANSGKIIQRLKTHSLWVNSAVFSPDGKFVLTASSDQTAALFDMTTGKMIRRFEAHNDDVNSAIFSLDCKYVLTASSDQTAGLFDANSGEMLLQFKGHDGGVLTAVFSSDGKYVLTASDDQTAAIFNAINGKLIQRLEGHTGWVNSAVFSLDGKYVLTASLDQTAALWDTKTSECVMTIGIFSDGWLNLDHENRYTAGENGLSYLTYYDPNEKSLHPTLWEAEDLPHMARKS